MKSRKDNLQYFLDHEDALFGHISFKTQNIGPRILIVGGTHGNEPSGVEAIIQWHKLLTDYPDLLKSGEVHFLLGNPEAYKMDQRYIDNDLNRTFHPNLSGKTIEEIRAGEIQSILNSLGPLDVTLDIHSVSKGDSQMMVYNRNQNDIQDFSLNMSPIDMHLTYVPEHIPGLLIDECAKKCEISLAIECGNHSDPYSPEVAFFHIYQLLLNKGMLEANQEWEEKGRFIKSGPKVSVYETMTPIKPNEGFRFVPLDYSTVSFFAAGSLYATSVQGEHIAPCDCYLVMPPERIRPTDFDAGFLCTRRNLVRY